MTDKSWPPDNDNSHWFTRRDGVIRGPYNRETITRYLLLGRIRMSDELSPDRKDWQLAGEIAGMVPEVMATLTGWDGYRQYLDARLKADERVGERRKSGAAPAADMPHDERRHQQRRDPHGLRLPGQAVPDTLRAEYRQRERVTRLRYLLLTLVLASLVFAWLVPGAR